MLGSVLVVMAVALLPTTAFAQPAIPNPLDALLNSPQALGQLLQRVGTYLLDQAVHGLHDLLIALTQKGVAREDAYQMVQRNAMKVWRGEGGDFLSLLKADNDVRKHLNEAELKENFDLGYHFKHVDTIFKRVFGES